MHAARRPINDEVDGPCTEELVSMLRGTHVSWITRYLPALRNRQSGNHADRCLPVLLSMHRLRCDAAAQARRLLRLLLLWLGPVSAETGRTFGRHCRGLPPFGM